MGDSHAVRRITNLGTVVARTQDTFVVFGIACVPSSHNLHCGCPTMSFSGSNDCPCAIPMLGVYRINYIITLIKTLLLPSLRIKHIGDVIDDPIY